MPKLASTDFDLSIAEDFLKQRKLKHLRAKKRADKSTVRFYEGAQLVKTHARQLPGGKSIDASDYPEHKTAYALRDVAFLEQQARKHGEAVGRFAHALLDAPLPWTRMRRVYRLLGLAKRYGDARVETACVTALAIEMIDVHRLERMLQLVPLPAPTPPLPASNVIPLTRSDTSLADVAARCSR